MKKISLALAALAVASASSMRADNCKVHIMVTELPATTVEVPQAVQEELTRRLSMALTNGADGVTASSAYDQFFVGGRFTHIYQDKVAGPPMQDVIHTNLTLYIGDINNQQVFSTMSLELRGVGTSEQRAYHQALTGINGKNQQIAAFVAQGRDKILRWYDSNYSQLLKRADAALKLRHYDEALAYATSIPECCKGYDQARGMIDKAWHGYIDYQGQTLLHQAQMAWAESPDEYGASQAHSYLSQIDPDAACWSQVVALEKEIRKTVQTNWTFENVEKYKDAVEADRRRVEAARAVGVAWGNGQKPTTTNLFWVR